MQSGVSRMVECSLNIPLVIFPFLLEKDFSNPLLHLIPPSKFWILQQRKIEKTLKLFVEIAFLTVANFS